MSNALTHYVFALASIYLIASLIDALAPTFGAEKNKLQALKLAAYASTPAWVAGVLLVLPSLAALGLLASLYLLYLGLPVMMKAPPDKAVGYTAVIVLVARLWRCGRNRRQRGWLWRGARRVLAARACVSERYRSEPGGVDVLRFSPHQEKRRSKK